jgi:hypothetical protein
MASSRKSKLAVDRRTEQKAADVAPPANPDVKAPRTATVERKTRETSVSVALKLDGHGHAEVSTGVPFLDHMLDSFTRH